MRSWVVVSFFTVGTGYEEEIKKLEASLKKFNLDYHFYPCEPVGSWRGNLNYKSQVILESFDRFPGKDIVFIDADGIVKDYPSLFDKLSNGLDIDVAAHFHPYKGTMIGGGSLLSGTLWFRNSDRGRTIVKKWHEIGIKHPTIRHQHCLRVAIHELAEAGFRVKIFKLPRAYTLIFDYYRKDRPAPVIEHFQASRRLRRQVGFGTGLLDSSFKTLREKERMTRQRHIRTKPATIRKERMMTTRGVDVETK